MVNVGLNWSSFVGIALAAAGAALYFLRSMRPKLARDHDIFFAAVALLCGGILFFQGWRQDPILQFGQFLLAGSAVFFAVESIRMRGITTEQAKRNAPIVDDERPVSQRYSVRAELDDLMPYEDRPRRIRGTRDSRPNRDEYEETSSRRPSNRTSVDDRYGSDRTRKRRPRPGEGIVDDLGIDSDDKPYRSRSSSAPPRPSGSSSSRPRRPRPTDDDLRSRERNVEPPSSEYVDYRPIETDDEEDNWS